MYRFCLVFKLICLLSGEICYSLFTYELSCIIFFSMFMNCFQIFSYKVFTVMLNVYLLILFELQGQCLINVGGDVVYVSYYSEDWVAPAVWIHKWTCFYSGLRRSSAWRSYCISMQNDQKWLVTHFCAVTFKSLYFGMWLNFLIRNYKICDFCKDKLYFINRL
jgi:hypothetical protein